MYSCMLHAFMLHASRFHCSPYAPRKKSRPGMGLETVYIRNSELESYQNFQQACIALSPDFCPVHPYSHFRPSSSSSPTRCIILSFSQLLRLQKKDFCCCNCSQIVHKTAPPVLLPTKLLEFASTVCNLELLPTCLTACLQQKPFCLAIAHRSSASTSCWLLLPLSIGARLLLLLLRSGKGVGSSVKGERMQMASHRNGGTAAASERVN